MLTIDVLGPLRVKRGATAVAPPGVRLRSILALLALHAEAPVGRDQLIEELGLSESTKNAANTLQAHIVRLRHWLEQRFEARKLLVTRADGYQLDLPSHHVDAHRFTAAVASAGRTGDDLAARLTAMRLASALELWRGPALCDAGDGPISRRFAGEFAERRVVAQERLIDLRLTVGDEEHAILDLDHLIVQHPFRERLWEQRMVALYRRGRQADALRSYQQVRELLATELGLEPGPGLQARLREVLQQAPSLSPAAVAAGV